MEQLSARERALLELLMDDQSLPVAAMAKRLGVSAVTVRSALNTLAEKGLILRTWGGASPAFHPAIVERQRTRTEAKARIAREAATLVGEGDAIMVEAGTTTSLIGRYLLGKPNVHVVTNSMLFVGYGRANPSLSITVVGGSFQPVTESLVGPLALRELEEFHVATAFIGTDGFSAASGTTTHLVEGAEIVRRMASLAERTILLADSSKYDRTGFVKVVPLAAVTMVISDRELSNRAAREIREAGVELRLV